MKILLSFSESDKKMLIFALVFALVVLLILGLLGMLIRFIMIAQGKKADDLVYDATKTYVVNSPKKFRRFGFKKSNRKFFKDSLPPVCIAIIALLVWLFTNIATGNWNRNIFDEFGDLFFKFDWVGTKENPVFVKVFFLTLLARWPDVTKAPTFVLEHLPSYIIVFLFIVSWVYYGIVCQAALARTIRLTFLSRSIFKKSLDGWNANVDFKINPQEPLPPNN